MPLYTAVDEGYEVEVYRTLKAASEAHADPGSFVVPDDEFDEEAPVIPATAAAIRKVLRAQGEVRISDDGGREWKYRITRHNTTQDKQTEALKPQVLNTKGGRRKTPASELSKAFDILLKGTKYEKESC